jgi:hypothetical protein
LNFSSLYVNICTILSVIHVSFFIVTDQRSQQKDQEPQEVSSSGLKLKSIVHDQTEGVNVQAGERRYLYRNRHGSGGVPRRGK